MPRRKKAKEDVESSNDVINKLESLEKKIEKISQTLKKSDRTTFVSNEDQLFFSFVFSLALLAITLPALNFSEFFSLVFQYVGIDFKPPVSPVLDTRIILIALLIAASSIRYLSAASEIQSKKRKATTMRIVSVEALFMAFYMLLFELLFRQLSSGLEGIHPDAIYILPVSLLVVCHFLGKRVEQKWLGIYELGRKGTPSKPNASITFFVISASILISSLLAKVLDLLLVGPYALSLYAVVAILIVVLLFSLISSLCITVKYVDKTYPG